VGTKIRESENKTPSADCALYAVRPAHGALAAVGQKISIAGSDCILHWPDPIRTRYVAVKIAQDSDAQV
jgi:hypothetical protein